MGAQYVLIVTRVKRETIEVDAERAVTSGAWRGTISSS